MDLNEEHRCDSKKFGEQLRGSREAAGLRVEDIVAETKVSKGILVALEEGQFHLLPERVFSRSFVAQYAHTVGAEEAPLMSAFDEAWDDYCASSGIHPNLEVVSVDLGRPIRWGFWIPIAAGVLILLVAAAVILRGSTSIDEGLAPDPRRSGVRQVAKSYATQTTAQPTPRMQPTVAAVAETQATFVDLTISVRTDEESWVHYRDREGMTGQRLLTNGEHLNLKLAGPVKLTIGNAGAIQLVVGGRTFSDLGLPGQVIHTEVTEEGFTRLGRVEAENS